MLADKEIVALVEEGSVKGVRKPPNWYTDESPVQPSSLDLHIGGIYLPGTGADQTGGENNPLSEHLLNPGETVLVVTEEVLDLPDWVGGITFPPSRFAVKALLVTNAGHVDAEYKGPLRFTVINMGHQTQKLEAKTRVGTLILFKTNTTPEKGWFSRTGKPGKKPTTNDLHYLSADFADFAKRAETIAKEEVQKANLAMNAIEHRLNRRLGWAGVIITLIAALIGGFFVWDSPVSKLETKVDLLHQEFSKEKEIEERLDKLESALKKADIAKPAQSIGATTTVPERKVK